MKSFLRQWLPPPVFKRLRLAFQRYGWFGDYSGWQAAANGCTGYNAQVVVDRAAAALDQVRTGSGRHERDSVVFAEPQYSWPLLAALMHVSALHGGILRALDFGGGLGSGYFQNQRFFQGLKLVQWSVVEQPSFTQRGRTLFPPETIAFFDTIDECVQARRIDVIIMSGVLQYLEHPFGPVEEAARCGIPSLVIDRTGFADDGSDHITVQRVSPAIYPASYPCWMFGQAAFEARLARHYTPFSSFVCDEQVAYPATYRGYIATLTGQLCYELPQVVC